MSDEAMQRLWRWSEYLADKYGPNPPEEEYERAMAAWNRGEEPPTQGGA